MADHDFQDQQPALPLEGDAEALTSPGFRWLRIDEIGTVQLGRQRSPKHRSSMYPTPYIRAANITDKGLDLRDVYEMEFDPDERRRYALRPGDILLSEASGSPHQVGKPAIWKDELSLCCFQNTVIRVRPRDAVPEYLLWLFTYLYRTGVFAEMAGGVGINHLGASKLSALRVPLPSLEQQRRIVDQIELQASRLDVAARDLEASMAKLHLLRTGLFARAFDGKLVSTEASLAAREGRSYVTGHEAVEEARSNLVRQRTRGSTQTSHEVQDEYETRVSPEGWEWSRLGDIAHLKSGLTKDAKRRTGQPVRSVPYLRVANVQRGYLDLREVKEIMATESQIRDLALQGGDILLNEGGDRDKLGRGWVWGGELPVCIHQNHVFRARLSSESIEPKLVSWYANAFGQEYFFQEGKQTTNLASISITKLRRFLVPVPPPAEQKRIVAELERQLSVAAGLEELLKASKARVDRLRSSVLRKSFPAFEAKDPKSVHRQHTKSVPQRETTPGARPSDAVSSTSTGLDVDSFAVTARAHFSSTPFSAEQLRALFERVPYEEFKDLLFNLLRAEGGKDRMTTFFDAELRMVLYRMEDL